MTNFSRYNVTLNLFHFLTYSYLVILLSNQRWQLQSQNAMPMVCARGGGEGTEMASGRFWLVSPFPPPQFEWHSDVLICRLSSSLTDRKWNAGTIENKLHNLDAVDSIVTILRVSLDYMISGHCLFICCFSTPEITPKQTCVCVCNALNDL
jgi:hypothetical protein